MRKQINRNLTRKQVQNLRIIENYIYRKFGGFLPVSYNDTRWGNISEI